MTQALKEKDKELNHEKKVLKGTVSKNELLESKIASFDKKERYLRDQVSTSDQKWRQEVRTLKREISELESQLQSQSEDHHQALLKMEQDHKNNRQQMFETICGLQ